jgi:hypothetical protein
MKEKQKIREGEGREAGRRKEREGKRNKWEKGRIKR